MKDELLRRKYRNLLNKLYPIINKLEFLYDDHDKLVISLKNNILVDNKIVEPEIYNNL